MMKKLRGLVPITLALASLPVVTAAQTGTFADMIVVSNVQALPSEIVGNGEMRRPGEIEFGFRDGGVVAASKIHFEVRDSNGRYLESIDVCGTFAPQVLIRKTVPNDSFTSTVSITALWAVFQDGSTWHREAASI